MSAATKQEGTNTRAEDSAAVPPGYKWTEVGVIPEDWDVKRLGEHVKYLRTGTNSRAELSSEGPTKYLHYGDVHTSTKVRLNPLVHPMPSLPEERARTLDRLRDGDLVFVDASEDLDGVGKSVEINGASDSEVVSGLHTIAARFDKSILVDGFKAYLQFCPAFRQHVRRLAAGTKVYATNRGHISSAYVPLPHPPEQLAIAEALSDVDGLLGALDALIAKKRAIKQAAMQQLLTGQTRLPGFSALWDTKRLGSCGSTYGGITGKSKADFGHGLVRYVTFLNVLENAVIHPHLFESVDIRPGESQNRVVRGDLLFNGTSETPGDLALGACVDQDYGDLYLNSFCFGFRFHKDTDHDSLFFAYFFRGPTGRQIMSALAQGATRYNMSKRQFLNLECELPEGNEQREISTVLSDMDTEIAAIEHRRDKTHAIKQGMMQQLLTGRVRLGKAERAANV